MVPLIFSRQLPVEFLFLVMPFLIKIEIASRVDKSEEE
jgi:hypothetical protein